MALKDWDFAPDWGPLETAVVDAGLPLEVCGEFMFMGRKPRVGTVDGIRLYKHRGTRAYLNLDERQEVYAYRPGVPTDYVSYGPVTPGVIAAVRGTEPVRRKAEV